MSNCSIALSANAGISLTFGQVRIWVDAVHQKKTAPFSTVTPTLWEQMQCCAAFKAPDLIFFTHCHPDHYSKLLTEQAKKRWPQAQLILPEPEFDDQLLLRGGGIHFQASGLSFHFFHLPHEGAQYASVPHYGLLLSNGRFQILIPGDCELASPILAQRLTDVSVDLAILDFPWITLRKGRDFIRQVIRPKHLLVHHLPFVQDDSIGYRRAAEKSAKLLPEIPDIRLLTEPLQIETL